MGRVNTRKPVKDVESPAESSIFSNLASSTLRNRNDASAQMSIEENLNSDKQIDDYSEKRH